MKKLHRTAVFVIVSLAAALCIEPAEAAEPGWSPVIIARGDQRMQIEATPIILRPYRPLHFYGNSVRRAHYRGNPMPRLVDVGRTFIYAIRRP